VADIPLPLARDSVERVQVRTRTTERFLTWPRTVALGCFVLFALTFNDGGVHDDGVAYFDFLRRLFGASESGVAYQFGSVFWNAPFWLVSQLVAVRGGLDHVGSGEVAVNVASAVAVLLALYLGWRILRALELPRGAAVLILTLFGTPLYFYGALGASYKHAADALYATALFWFVYRALQAGATRLDYAAVGASLALLVSTRWANAALCLVVVGAFLTARRKREAVWMVSSLIACSALLFSMPVVRHIPYDSPPTPTYGLGKPSLDLPLAVVPHSQRLASSSVVIIDPVLRQTDFSPTAPLKMLFTLHRGLFVFTPLTFFAAVGFVLLLRRDRRNRPFLLTLGLSALALLLIHSFWGKLWDGGGSFSQRFLTALFPFFLLGTAEFIRRWRGPAIALLSLCAAWSVWVGLVQFNAYYRGSAQDGIVQIVGSIHGVTGPRVSRFHKPPPYNSLENFGRDLGDRISGRWRQYWRLVT
jgi:hypothetical protein